MAWRDSEPVAVTLALRGVHLHDPALGGEASASVFPYGADSKEDSMDTMGTGAFYAGRQDPVVDFGEHVGEAVAVTVDLPHGPTYIQDLEDIRSWAARRRTIHYRDGRTRALYGTLTDVRRRDQAWGTQVSFTVTRTHWDAVTVSA
jgi:hypothetical protein